VLRHAGEIEARKSGHATSIPLAHTQHHRRTPRQPSAQRPTLRQKLSLTPLLSVIRERCRTLPPLPPVRLPHATAAVRFTWLHYCR
jgi:hypothetical protein